MKRSEQSEPLRTTNDSAAGMAAEQVRPTLRVDDSSGLFALRCAALS